MFCLVLLALFSAHSDSFASRLEGAGLEVTFSSSQESSVSATFYRAVWNSKAHLKTGSVSVSKQKFGMGFHYSVRMTGQDIVILKRNPSFVKLGIRGEIAHFIVTSQEQSELKIRDLKCYPAKVTGYQCILNLKLD